MVQEKELLVTEIKANKVYDIKYQWAGKWLKGWGRYIPEKKGKELAFVNVITYDGGVSNMEPGHVRFLKLTNI